jgi:hypothetical protein
LGAGVEVLKRATPAQGVVRAKGCDALRARLVKLFQIRQLEARLAPPCTKLHVLAGQRAFDEDYFAGMARHAAAILIQRKDLGAWCVSL